MADLSQLKEDLVTANSDLAKSLGKALARGEVIYLSDGEIAANTKGRADFTLERGWENWCRQVGRSYYPLTWDVGPGFSCSDK